MVDLPSRLALLNLPAAKNTSTDLSSMLILTVARPTTHYAEVENLLYLPMTCAKSSMIEESGLEQMMPNVWELAFSSLSSGHVPILTHVHKRSVLLPMHVIRI